MKRLAFIAAVVFTTLTLQSCRQSDEIFSPEETATLKKVQDPSNTSLIRNTNSVNTEQIDNSSSVVDGEIVPPPKK